MTDPTAFHRQPVGVPRPNWGAEALWQALVPLLPGLSIEIVERLESTNTELTDRLRSASRVQQEGRGSRQGDLFPQLLVATHQTAGRGRLGRRWASTPGASLTFSLALPLHRADWSGLSLAVGLAVVEALDLMLCEAGDALTGEGDARMGRKMGGILIESVAVSSRRAAVIGIGVNVGMQRMVEADYGTASLTEIWPDATPQDALSRIGVPLAEALVAFDRDGFAPLQDAYARRDVLRGRQVKTTDATMPGGTAVGVDADGALRISSGGSTHRVLSGEVSVRLAGDR
jgi:BirA family biotin operon repressor/biotin-[acetyl-CoA-carboxylase] ligase